MALGKALATALLAIAAVPAQTDESFAVAGEHPLIFLRPQRLRLLRRERDRKSPRWTQFGALIAGRAAMAEPGFALALYFQASGDRDSGRRAAAWAVSPPADLRQAALVYDWCQPALDPAQTAALAARLKAAIESPPKSAGVAEARSRALAAIAVSDAAAAASERELARLVQKWWRGEIAPALRAGKDVVRRADLYALFEFLHAMRDNTGIDLRESAPDYFKQLPAADLLSYYPASYPAAENEFRIPAVKGAEPDLRLATMARAADLAMVAYDTNATENQYIQGWAMHDRFILRGPVGAPYEYLWANPYQPGLSYYNLPLVLHDAVAGRLFIRSRWDDDAVWLGYFGGELQTFADGEPKVVPPRALAEPVQFGDTIVASGTRITVKQEAKTVFVLGLEPSRAYQVEPDWREMREERTDRGGILELTFPEGFDGAIRLKPVSTSSGS